jgi:bifunctional non-homologous end joining protein LigD
VLAYKDGDRVRLVSRQGKDLTRRFAGLVLAVGTLEARTSVLDGEVAVFDPTLRSRDERLRGRPKTEIAPPPMLMVFDCLYARGEGFAEAALHVRRHVLEAELEGQWLILPAAAV